MIEKTLISAGAGALEAEARKRTEYSGLLNTYSFAPVAAETLGVWGAEAEDLLKERSLYSDSNKLLKLVLKNKQNSIPSPRSK